MVYLNSRVLGLDEEAEHWKQEYKKPNDSSGEHSPQIEKLWKEWAEEEAAKEQAKSATQSLEVRGLEDSGMVMEEKKEKRKKKEGVGAKNKA